MDSSTLTLWTDLFPMEGVSGKFLLQYFIEILVFNSNNVDLDWRPNSADLGLHCLSMSLVWDTRHNLTLSFLQNKTGTCANSVDPYETARNEPPHQDVHCLPFCL